MSVSTLWSQGESSSLSSSIDGVFDEFSSVDCNFVIWKVHHDSLGIVSGQQTWQQSIFGGVCEPLHK